MRLVTSVEEMSGISGEAVASGVTVGFVPTMGYLHEGHLSLIRAARAQSELAVVSIFVNPTQFGRGEDLGAYPRDAEGDMRKCEAAGVDVVFMPTASGMYPEGYGAFVEVDDRLTGALCGASRPGHFRGVATVVTKLFNIVRPTRAYFGAKDFQQTVVIRRLAADLNFPVAIVVLPTVREADGLAMSSRNKYLDPIQRAAATAVYRAITEARAMFRSGETDPAKLTGHAVKVMSAEGLITPEYAELVEPDSLRPATAAREGMALAVAVRLGQARLIDNITL